MSILAKKRTDLNLNDPAIVAEFDIVSGEDRAETVATPPDLSVGNIDAVEPVEEAEPVVIVDAIENIEMCSGFGGYHTNSPLMPDGTKRPDSKRTPYIGITLKGIRDLVDNPQSVDKAQAQWLIPSSDKSEDARTHIYQNQKGKFWYLWADLDDNPPTIKELDALLTFGLGCNYEIYTSRSATEEKQKSRIIIPLDKPLLSSFWSGAQMCLNDWLEKEGVTPDRANERTAQLAYLPNKGKFYANAYARTDDYFDPLTHFKEELDVYRLAKAKFTEGQQKRVAAAKIKKAERTSVGFDSPVDAFNELYLVEGILIKNGYTQKPGQPWLFMHPASETGSYSASIKDNRVHSLSSGDPLCTLDGTGKSGGAHDAYSVFTILHHNGDEAAALKDVGDRFLKIGNEPWNKVKQREFKQGGKKGVQVNLADFEEVKTDDDIGNIEPEVINDVDLTAIIGADSYMAIYIRALAREAMMPVNTVFLTVVSIASLVLSRSHTIAYEHNGVVPAVLNLIAEQPPGTSKSRVLKAAQSGVFKAVKTELTVINETLKAMAEKDDLTDEETMKIAALRKKKAGLFEFITDATPEALDATLGESNGFFALASAEQALLNTLLGLSYGAGNKSNVDLMLKGFNGEYHSSKRKSREVYTGMITGGFVCLAQNEIIVNTLKQSGSTGLIERCLLWSEPSLIGQRNFLENTTMDAGVRDKFNNTMSFLTRLSFAHQAIDFDDLPALRVSTKAWHRIKVERNKLELTIAPGGVNSATMLQGAISKMDMVIIKMAAVLHSMDFLMKGEDFIATDIDDCYIDQGIEIYHATLKHTKGLISNSSIIALSDRETKVMTLIEDSSNKELHDKVIRDKLYRASCFKSDGAYKRDNVQDTLISMQESGLLIATLVEGLGSEKDKILISIA